MPKIEIRERDLTARLNTDTIVNTVYMPGYANIGPINTPTLCETLEEFQSIFGTQPYLFRQGQEWAQANTTDSGFDSNSVSDTMGKMYQVGEPEKSYIIATELLSNGIPVLYERVFDTDNISTWTAKSSTYTDDNSIMTIKADNPGKAYSKVAFKIDDLQREIGAYVKVSNTDNQFIQGVKYFQYNSANDTYVSADLYKTINGSYDSTKSYYEWQGNGVYAPITDIPSENQESMSPFYLPTDASTTEYDTNVMYYCTRNGSGSVTDPYVYSTEAISDINAFNEFWYYINDGSNYVKATLYNSNETYYTRSDDTYTEASTQPTSQSELDEKVLYSINNASSYSSAESSSYCKIAEFNSITTFTQWFNVTADNFKYVYFGGRQIDSDTSDYYFIKDNANYKQATASDYYTAEYSLTSMSISVKMDKDDELGIKEINSITTVITTNRAIATQSSKISFVQTGVPFVDNSGLISITIKDTADIPTSTDYEFLSLSNPEMSGEDEFTPEYIYTMLSSTEDSDGNPLGLYRLLDKGEYIIKFISAGAYPIFGYIDNSTNSTQVITENMLRVAANRGDCTALIDHTPNGERALQITNNTSVYSKMKSFVEDGVDNSVNQFGESIFNYGAMFTPWATVPTTVYTGRYQLPASFIYLYALGNQLQYTTDWLATAGVSRGLCSNILSLQQNVTNAIADSYQPRNSIAINPITNIKPYGFTIWGARTLKNNAIIQELSATSFLNIRQISNDVKRAVWVAAKSLTYEQNTDILWIRFKGKLIPLLNQMVQGNAITSYEFVRTKTTKKATVSAIIRLYPVEPVEDWDITIELADDLTVTTVG